MANENKNSTQNCKKGNTIYWFRKSLRIHDNPGLNWALENSYLIYPIFILDPWFVKSSNIGFNRWTFLLDSLEDLNFSLQKIGSRLFFLQGDPIDVFKDKLVEWNTNYICFEGDTEPYSIKRDNAVQKLLKEMSVDFKIFWTHTLYNPYELLKINNGDVVLNYSSFLNILKKIGLPEKPVKISQCKLRMHETNINEYKISKLEEILQQEYIKTKKILPGGETEALKRMESFLKNEDWVCKFKKPVTSPFSLTPSTTCLSPYFKFGCLSPRLFYYKILEIYKKKEHTTPPESLLGQLLWREFFYFIAAFTPNFDKIKGNPICKQIKWKNDEKLLYAWEESKTGYPLVDAVMSQLRQEGWIHHLARHLVACFLTRGDLYCNWELGRDVFEKYLIDADWSLNNANWMWLSASAFFTQYFRVYSPITFGKKYDKNGDYIRKYIPILNKFPSKYIYEPWKASINIQKESNCIIGKDYPFPIVDHAVVLKENIEKMKQAYRKDS